MKPLGDPEPSGFPTDFAARTGKRANKGEENPCCRVRHPGPNANLSSKSEFSYSMECVREYATYLAPPIDRLSWKAEPMTDD